MYNYGNPTTTGLSVNTSVEGEMIEVKVERIVVNKEPIKDGAPIIYTERKDGVQPAYDIRTDRWEIALDAMDKVTKAHIAKREDKLKENEAKIIDLNKDKTNDNTTESGA